MPGLARLAVRRLLGRLVSLLVALLVLSGAIFLVLDVLPGDPAAIMLGTSAREDTLTALRATLGLDRPAPARYAAWIAGLATGDLGVSTTYGVPVGGLIAERFAVTGPLAVLALLLVVLVAPALGVVAAAHRGDWPDLAARAFAASGLAVPNFWLGLLLILGLAIGTRWFPAGGFPGWSAGLGPALHALVLPALALALPQAAVLTRVARAAALDALGGDYVRTARAKGVGEGRILARHVLPNALGPVLTVLGLQAAFLVAGAVLVENVFTLPGLGRLAYQSLAQRDLPVIRSVVLVLAVLVLAVNGLVEGLRALADPRLARGRSIPA